MELDKEAAMRGKDEKELENLNIQMSGMLESISDGFLSLNEQLVLTYFNKAAERLLNRKRDEVI